MFVIFSEKIATSIRRDQLAADFLVDLRAKYDLSIIFISHDLGVIHHIADRVLVMKDGEIVEEGPAQEIFNTPRHSYTQELIAALPLLERAAFKRAA